MSPMLLPLEELATPLLDDLGHHRRNRQSRWVGPGGASTSLDVPLGAHALRTQTCPGGRGATEGKVKRCTVGGTMSESGKGS